MATHSDTRIKVGIVGGTGYTGVELLRLLSQHPQVELVAITSRKEDGVPVSDMYPNLRGHVDLKFSTPENANLEQCDVVFFATPHGVAMSQVERLLEAGVRVIDLAADFRLQDTDVFQKWYKMEHSCPDILSQSAYGLPELLRDKIAQAKVIGNPGCYPTTVLLGLAPLLEGGKALVDTQHLIADCKSGVSGAGKGASVPNLFAEASDNFKAYGVSGHRHHPESVLLAGIGRIGCSAARQGRGQDRDRKQSDGFHGVGVLRERMTRGGGASQPAPTASRSRWVRANGGGVKRCDDRNRVATGGGIAPWTVQPPLSTSRSLSSRMGLIRVITERKPLNSASRRASLA